MCAAWQGHGHVRVQGQGRRCTWVGGCSGSRARAHTSEKFAWPHYFPLSNYSPALTCWQNTTTITANMPDLLLRRSHFSPFWGPRACSWAQLVLLVTLVHIYTLRRVCS